MRLYFIEATSPDQFGKPGGPLQSGVWCTRLGWFIYPIDLWYIYHEPSSYESDKPNKNKLKATQH